VHIYVLGPELLQWNIIKICLMSIQSEAHILSADFWSFRNFRPQFAKVVAPPGDDNRQCLGHPKGQSFQKKYETIIKIDS